MRASFLGKGKIKKREERKENQIEHKSKVW
jgi:hypothetical protein